MRNAFVVLVSLCIGVASRFIVPSTVTKNTLSSVSPNEKDEDVTLKANLSTMTTLHGELPNNRTHIDENALYEHAADKQNNQSERAFIYINQKYKRPSSLHNYFKIPQTIPEFPQRFQQPKAQAIVLPRHNEPCKSHPAPVNSYFQGYDFPASTQDISSYFGSSSLFNCNNEPLNYNYRGNLQRLENYNAYNKISGNHRDYIELLKSPILRPVSRGRPRYDGVPAPQYSPLSYQDFVKLQRANKPHNAKAHILVDERKNAPRRHYGFDSAYNPQNAYQSKGLLNRVEEPHFDGDFVNDDESSHIASIEKGQDEDKLLDQYLKDTLEDQVTSKENPVIANDCSYRDCILQSTKPSSSVGHQKIYTKNPECKCGQRFKENEATISRDRQERQEYKRNQNQTKTNTKYHPAKLSGSAYYETVASEDTNKNRGHDQLNKLNNTFYH